LEGSLPNLKNFAAGMDAGWDQYPQVFAKQKLEAKNPQGCGFLAQLARYLLSLSLSLSLSL
jgi:hypothetical protein